MPDAANGAPLPQQRGERSSMLLGNGFWVGSYEQPSVLEPPQKQNAVSCILAEPPKAKQKPARRTRVDGLQSGRAMPKRKHLKRIHVEPIPLNHPSMYAPGPSAELAPGPSNSTAEDHQAPRRRRMRNFERISGQLRKCVLFAHATDEQLHACCARMQLLSISPGAVVVRQGETGDHLFIVRSGSLCAVRAADGRSFDELLADTNAVEYRRWCCLLRRQTSPAGAQGILACLSAWRKELATTDSRAQRVADVRIHVPGEMFGELALLYACTRPSTVICLPSQRRRHASLWALSRHDYIRAMCPPALPTPPPVVRKDSDAAGTEHGEKDSGRSIHEWPLPPLRAHPEQQLQPVASLGVHTLHSAVAVCMDASATVLANMDDLRLVEPRIRGQFTAVVRAVGYGRTSMVSEGSGGSGLLQARERVMGLKTRRMVESQQVDGEVDTAARQATCEVRPANCPSTT